MKSILVPTTLLIGFAMGCGTSVDSGAITTPPATVLTTTSTQATSVATSSSTTSMAPVLLRAPETLESEYCRVPEIGHKSGTHSVGFPVDNSNLKADQRVRLAVIALDWFDYPGDPEELEKENEDVKKFVDAYEVVSNGLLSFDVAYATKWYRLPESVSAYATQQTSDFNSKLAQHAVTTADPDFDFSLVDLTIFVLPSFAPIPSGVPQRTDQFGGFQHFNGFSTVNDPRMIFSDEGWVRNYIGAGTYFDVDKRPAWSYYLHEAAHTFHFPDWYRREANYVLGSDEVKNLGYEVGPMSVWSVMSSQNGPSRTFDSWARWLMGWLKEEQVACFDLLQVIAHGEFDIELTPLDVYETGVKSVIIRTGPHSALVVESRRPVFLDENLVAWQRVGRDPFGLIVYEVDTSIPDAEGTLSLVLPEGQGIEYIPYGDPDVEGHSMADALYNLGAVGYSNSLKVELINSGDRDVVRITPMEGDRPDVPSTSTSSTLAQAALVFYNNCDEVRAVGRAPVMKGDPGYRPELDPDGDGIACSW